MKMVKSLLLGVSIESIIEGNGGYHDPFHGIDGGTVLKPQIIEGAGFG